jgi:hypothetical protein
MIIYKIMENMYKFIDAITPLSKTITKRLEIMDEQFILKYTDKAEAILNDGTEYNELKELRLLKELEKCMEKNAEYNKILIAKLKEEIKEAEAKHEKEHKMNIKGI